MPSMRGVIFYFLEISIILHNKYRVFRNQPHFQDKFSHKTIDIRVHTNCSIAVFCAYRDVGTPSPTRSRLLRKIAVPYRIFESRRLSVTSFRIEIAYCYPLTIRFSPSKKAAAHCPGAISTHNVSDFDSSLTPVP